MLGELQLVEKKINGCNPAVPGNDEISTSVSWRVTRAARYPLDPPAIAYFLGLGYWLISKVRVSSLDRARDSIDLVAASVDTSLGIVEHAIFGEDLRSRRAPTRRVVLTGDFVKIGGQQGRYAVGHGYCFSSWDRVPLALADAILPPVNDDCLPGNERGIVACQKQNRPGNVLRFLHPLNGLLFPGGAFLLFRLWRGCQSIRQARQHRVRGDTVVCNIIRQPSHEPDNAHLCGDVMAHAGNGQSHHVRRYADEAAPLLLSHCWQEVLRAQKVGIQVRGERFPPRRQIQFVD